MQISVFEAIFYLHMVKYRKINGIGKNITHENKLVTYQLMRCHVTGLGCWRNGPPCIIKITPLSKSMP